MANRTVRVALPVNDTDEFLKVAESLIKKHEADPATSKLSADEVAQLKSTLALARPLREAAAKLRKEAQAAQEQCSLALGLGVGQTSKTKGTAYNLLTRMRKRLLLEFEGEEEQLGTYGLNVVIGTAKPRGANKAQKAAPGA